MRLSPMRPCAVALFLLASQSACARVYEPAASPRINIRGDGVLVKDGAKIRTLADAVRSNPAAEAEARLSNRDGLTGGILMLGGSVTMLGGVVTGYALSAGRETLTPASTAVLLGGAIVGLGTMIVGTVFASNGERHGYNAINLYNDGLPPSPARAPAPAPAAPAPR